VTKQQAQYLLRNAVVTHDGDPQQRGVVIEVGHSGFIVEWENGLRAWIAFRAAQAISLWYPRLDAHA
jgi:hypothetical protein